MSEILAAILEPLGKVLLEVWLSHAIEKISSKRRADITRRARELASATVADLEVALGREGLTHKVLLPAATELGATLNKHLDTKLLIQGELRAEAVEKSLLEARPVSAFYKRGEPEREAYLRLVSLLAPRLCALAPDLPDYSLVRDSALLAQMGRLVRDAPNILAELGEVRNSVQTIQQQIERTDRFVKKIKKTTDRTARTISRAATKQEAEKAAFAVAYRKTVRDTLDYVEILGLPDLGPGRREAKLSVAYLSLTTNTAGIGRLDYDRLLDVLPFLGGRLLIEGAAGSGKSTLLRWTAIQAAQEVKPNVFEIGRDFSIDAAYGSAWNPLVYRKVSDRPTSRLSSNLIIYHNIDSYLSGSLKSSDTITTFMRDKPPVFISHGSNVSSRSEILGGIRWQERIPFQIRLRHLKEGLPEPGKLPAHLSVALGQPPQGWVRELLNAGRAILLIDGVDEVPEGERREAALSLIQDYARLYDKSLIIVASRPGACDKTLFRELKFVEAQVDELSDEQRDSFIDNWHLAYANAILPTPHDPDPKGIASALKRALANQRQIALLATNPLLCAGICALHERMPDSLPKSEWDLCEKLTAMLADQRDRRAGRQGSVDIDEFGPAYRVAYSIRRSVLARLADAMVTQQLSALPRAEALAHVKATLKGVRDAGELKSEDLLASLVARSGVLREASIQPGLPGDSNADDERDAVEFVHNTLKAWLASLQTLEHNKPIALARDALASEIGEVIVFAAAAPTHRIYAEKLIKWLLTFASEQTDAGSRRAVEVIALRCDAAAPVLGPKLRDQLAQLADRLFPPATFDEAQQLAALGDAAAPRLERSRVDRARAPATIRCLRLIGSEPARETLEGYRDATDQDALEELAQTFDPLTLPAVLDAAQDAQQWFQLRPSIKGRIQSLSAIAHQRNLRELYLSRANIEDLSPLSSFHSLQKLDLSNTRVKDLSPLSDLTHLETLNLNETPVDDLLPLANLKGLWTTLLSGVTANLAPLANCTSLEHLVVGSDTIQDLRFLVNLVKIDLLAITRSKVTNLGELDNLKSLSMFYIWNSGVHDLLSLKNLPLLRILNLRNSPIEDLASLQYLTHLEELALGGLPAVDLEALVALRDLKKLSIFDMRVETLAPLASLSKLEFLDIRKTQVKSLEPIMNLQNLRILSAEETPVSDDELSRFMAAVPGREVNTLLRDAVPARPQP